MRNFKEYVAQKQRQYGEKFDASGLNPVFIRYFESGQRIKVCMYGEEVTGTIGVTTGWKPCFLRMRRSNAYGSSDCIGHDTVLLAVKHGRAYVAL